MFDLKSEQIKKEGMTTHAQRLYSNGIDLIADADCLAQNGRYRRALSLLICAYEQFNKVILIAEGKPTNVHHNKNFKYLDQGMEQTKDVTLSKFKNKFIESGMSESAAEAEIQQMKKNHLSGFSFKDIRNSSLYEDEKPVGYTIMLEYITSDGIHKMRQVVVNLKTEAKEFNKDLIEQGLFS